MLLIPVCTGKILEIYFARTNNSRPGCVCYLYQYCAGKILEFYSRGETTAGAYRYTNVPGIGTLQIVNGIQAGTKAEIILAIFGLKRYTERLQEYATKTVFSATPLFFFYFAVNGCFETVPAGSPAEKQKRQKIVKKRFLSPTTNSIIPNYI